MPLPSPKFEEGQAWDGTTPRSRPTTSVFKHADGEIASRHSSEIIALEELLKDVFGVVDIIANPGAANSVLGVKGDASGLEYKDLVAGPGITFAHTIGGITITASAAASQLEAEAAADIKIGNPIYLKSNGQALPAQANSAAKVQVVGLAISDTLTTFTCPYFSEGQIDRNDWTDIADVVLLTPGAVYFLSADSAGKITTVATTLAGQYVVYIGRAITATKLDITISQPILL
jgi:hypothetical protein